MAQPIRMSVTNIVCRECGKAKYIIVDYCELQVVSRAGEHTAYNVALKCPRCQHEKQTRLH